MVKIQFIEGDRIMIPIQPTLSSTLSFNQQTGNEQKNALIGAIMTQKNRIAVLTEKRAQLPIADKSNRRHFNNAIRDEKNKCEDLQLALSSLEKDLAIDREMDVNGIFGPSVFGRCISGIAQSVAIPITIGLRFATDHPYLAFGVAIASQLVGVVSAPVTTAIAQRKDLDENQRQRQINTQFQQAISECRNEEKLTALCANKLIKAWKDNDGDIEKQTQIEDLLTNQHKSGKYLDGYVETAVRRAANWQKCAKDDSTASNERSTAKCKIEYDKWLHIAETSLTIYHHSKMAVKENVLDVNPTGNISDSHYPLEERLVYAKLSNYAYSRNESNIPENWSLNKTLGHQLSQECNFSYDESTGQIYTKAGLVAYLFDKVETNSTSPTETCLVFGGTTSGFKTGPIGVRVKHNHFSTAAHLYANAASALSLETPQIHLQAKRLTETLEQHITENQPNSQISLTGHSLGAGLCSYAAAMTGTPSNPTPCFGFSPAPITGASLKDIARRAVNTKHAERIRNHIKHTAIAGDPIPNVKNHVSGAHVLGEITELPETQAMNGMSMASRHGEFEEILRKRLVLESPELQATRRRRHHHGHDAHENNGHHKQREHKSPYHNVLNFEYVIPKTLPTTTARQKPVFSAPAGFSLETEISKIAETHDNEDVSDS